MGKKILTVVGARPQFVKMGMVSRAVERYNSKTKKDDRLVEVIVHTGQHYDENMSSVFFREMRLPEPTYHLGVAGLSHGAMTGRMLEKIEQVILKERPQVVLVYGDTNSTLAGALAAAKMDISLAHVEAGLRSYNRRMPEETNRVVVDHVSDVLFCPTKTAVMNLEAEGIRSGVYDVGDVMCDSVLHYKDPARSQSKILEALTVLPGAYFLATLHRPANIDDPDRLGIVLEAFRRTEETIILAAHPRCRMALSARKQEVPSNVRVIDPLGYMDMLQLMQHAKAILTDSGGIQKEAYLVGVPCITLREETEWVETVESGWNRVVGLDPNAIVSAATHPPAGIQRPQLFGDGHAADRIVDILSR